MRKVSKIYKNLSNSKIKNKKLTAKEILEMVKKNCNTKFDESIDVSLKINLKQSNGGDFSLRTVVNLPNGSGKKNKIAVLCEPEKAEEAKKAGADVVGSNDLIEKILSIGSNHPMRKKFFSKLIIKRDTESISVPKIVNIWKYTN